MSRLACVELPSMPLQLLLRAHPEWRGLPAAVVSEDRPGGRILWVNEQAHKRGVLRGMRSAEGLSLARELRAGEVAQSAIDAATAQVCECLWRFTPDVEPAPPPDAGTFWLNAAGFSHGYVFPSLGEWAQALHAALLELGFVAATVVVGYTRFGTAALAKAYRGPVVFPSELDEHEATLAVPLARLGMEPKARDALAVLGVHTVGALLDLPHEGLLKRFGPAVQALHRAATGALRVPLAPAEPPEPIVDGLILDNPDSDATRLMFFVKQRLPGLLSRLAARFEALQSLSLSLVLAQAAGTVEAEVRPAEPTLDEVQLMDLVRLRLERVTLDAGVVEVGLTVTGIRATTEQLRLFLAECPRRDLRAGDRALARLRAELGEDAVTVARLRDAHLPEASFAFEPLAHLVRPAPTRTGPRTLVRRLRKTPEPLPESPRPRHGDGAVLALLGPYVLSGGWWGNAEMHDVERQYHFAETLAGDLLWLYYDRRTRAWFQHGQVE